MGCSNCCRNFNCGGNERLSLWRIIAHRKRLVAA